MALVRDDDLTPLPLNFLNEFTRLTKMFKLDPWAAENHIPSERRIACGVHVR
jgi:hypothetical protein